MTFREEEAEKEGGPARASAPAPFVISPLRHTASSNTISEIVVTPQAAHQHHGQRRGVGCFKKALQKRGSEESGFWFRRWVESS